MATRLTRKERKEVRVEEALERATQRDAFLNKHGRDGYVQLLQHLNVKFPTGAKKEKAKLTRMINALKK